MNCMIMSLIWAPMSVGWSPTAIFVMPGRSISVMFRTNRKGEINKMRQNYIRQNKLYNHDKIIQYIKMFYK